MLLSTNTKLNKGLKENVKTFGIHFAPYKLSGKNVCHNASKGCAAACLNLSGMGIYKTVQAARLRKTQYFNNDRIAFMIELKAEIVTQIRRAKKNGMVPVKPVKFEETL